MIKLGVVHAATEESKNEKFRLPLCQQTNGYKGGRVLSCIPIEEFKALRFGQCQKCKNKINKMG